MTSEDNNEQADTEKFYPARTVYVGYPSDARTGVSVGSIVDALWLRKWKAFACVVAFGLLGIAYCVVVAPKYRAEMVLAIKSSESDLTLPSALSGLSSLAGIDLQASSDTNESLAYLHSRLIAERFIVKYDLLPILYEDRWDAPNKKWTGDEDDWPNLVDGADYFLSDVFTINSTGVTNILSISVDWTDPVMAADWASAIIALANEDLRVRDLENSRKRLDYLRTQLNSSNLVELRSAISRLIETEIQSQMMASVDEEYIFRVIDPARIPNDPFSPKFALVILLSVFLGGFVAVLFIYISSVRRATT